MLFECFYFVSDMLFSLLVAAGLALLSCLVGAPPQHEKMPSGGWFAYTTLSIWNLNQIKLSFPYTTPSHPLLRFHVSLWIDSQQIHYNVPVNSNRIQRPFSLPKCKSVTVNHSNGLLYLLLFSGSLLYYDNSSVFLNDQLTSTRWLPSPDAFRTVSYS